MNVLAYLVLLLVAPLGFCVYYRRLGFNARWVVMLGGAAGWWGGCLIAYAALFPFLSLFATGPALFHGIYAPLWGAGLPLAVEVVSDRTGERLSVGGVALCGALAGTMLGVGLAVVGRFDPFPRGALEQVAFVVIGCAGGAGAAILGTLAAADKNSRQRTFGDQE